ncbi:hypothetical protein COL26_31465 [Bacillus thuringiensis]|uniref:Major capsid protein n=1 Tax=Bacillus thuringiensis TaxID=1428 RepID=A0ABD6S1D1_BACTU|nr:hypothetical protein [Bacillus thuringiensis]PER48306.1 hypothetical protein CN495_24245 [Bacillus thuringiensis]PEU74211.1 hypothetical protein CN411_32170 [Bacillus thuringiensis]PFH99665.1 hypothetical protein COI79_32765 [Bacillus thuringiensis]PFW23510.1 hypothetical protein COL26_31465 [Bacillus thuringiensis]PGY80162.1 hypothetical protein COE44_09325 [Bacillus thuringiensis]
MALNAQAQFLSILELTKGLLENSPKRLQHLEIFPFHHVEGDSLRYVRTPELTPASIIGFGDPIPDNTTIPDEPITFPMSELATSFLVAYKGQDIYSYTNDLVKLEEHLATRQLLYKFSEQLESGTNGFLGFTQLIKPSNVTDLNGNTLKLEDLDRAKGQIRVKEGESGVIFTNQSGYEQIRKAYYNRNQIPPVLNGKSSFDGWKIYINDFQPTHKIKDKDKPTTNIWFASLGMDALHGIIPENVGDNMFVTRKTVRTEGSEIVVHKTWPVGLALGSQAALASVKNVAI